MRTTFKQMELESPGCSNFEAILIVLQTWATRIFLVYFLKTCMYMNPTSINAVCGFFRHRQPRNPTLVDIATKSVAEPHSYTDFIILYTYILYTVESERERERENWCRSCIFALASFYIAVPDPPTFPCSAKKKIQSKQLMSDGHSPSAQPRILLVGVEIVYISGTLYHYNVVCLRM